MRRVFRSISIFSSIYKTGLALHRIITPEREVQVPVISVGNITTGGTGKTPFIMKIVSCFDSSGNFAVVSRGYGRKSRKLVEVRVDSDYRETGDEPLMIKKNFPDIPVIVSKNRYRGALAALSMGVGAVILDDGFQSWELKRDLDIVLVDAGDPFGGGKFLPFGRLREPPAALNRADTVVITKSNYVSRERVEKTVEKVSLYAPVAEIFIATEKITGFREVFGTGVRDADFIRGKNVLCFSAVGVNDRFRSLVESAGGVVVEKIEKLDHHNWKEKDIKEICRMADGRDILFLTTEKDAVKLSGFDKFNCYSAILETEIEDRKRFKEKIDDLFN